MKSERVTEGEILQAMSVVQNAGSDCITVLENVRQDP